MVWADGTSQAASCFKCVESGVWCANVASSFSTFKVSELSTLILIGASKIEVAWVLWEEVLEEEESLPDSSEIEEAGRFFVKSSGLDPALEVI